jgi:hypothetical protein
MTIVRFDAPVMIRHSSGLWLDSHADVPLALMLL